MTFDELVELLRNPGDEGLPETIYDDLSASYGHLSESSAAKIADMDAALRAKDEEISRLKSMNYDLMMSSPGTDSVDDNDDNDDNNDDDAPASIDDLFEGDED